MIQPLNPTDASAKKPAQKEVRPTGEIENPPQRHQAFSQFAEGPDRNIAPRHDRCHARNHPGADPRFPGQITQNRRCASMTPPAPTPTPPSNRHPRGPPAAPHRVDRAARRHRNLRGREVQPATTAISPPVTPSSPASVRRQAGLSHFPPEARSPAAVSAAMSRKCITPERHRHARNGVHRGARNSGSSAELR